MEEFSPENDNQPLGEDEQIEDIDESGTISVPFDPNLIKITTQPLTLGGLIDRLEHDGINMFTDFQRKADLWDETKQSRLIESVLLRLPIPLFYFDGEDDNVWQVVDGLQRISTLDNFVIRKTLALENLEFLKQFNGKPFDELPRELQRRIKTFPITVVVIEKGTPEEVKYHLFSRINQGGLILTPQEIRHALHQGKSAELVNVLAEEPLFKEATCHTVKSERMQDRDFVTRFVAFYLLGDKNYQPDLDSFLSRGMAKIAELDSDEKAQLKAAFRRAMQLAIDIFGNDAFRKRKHPDDRRRPLNKALFECLSVNLAYLTDEQAQTLVRGRELFKKSMMKSGLDEQFMRAITSGTGLRGNVQRRFREIRFNMADALSIASDDQETL